MKNTGTTPLSYWLERGLLLFALLVAVAVYFYVRSPELRELVRPDHCLFYRLTGLLCPACGATRSVIHLLNGNILLALKSNVLAVMMMPLFFYILFLILKVFINPRFSLAQVRIAPVWLWSWLAIILLFWLIRNIPAFSFLRPLF